MVKPMLCQSLMQACRSAYSVYKNRRTREQKVKKAKEQRLKDQRGKRKPKNKRKPSCLWRGKSEGWKIEKNLSVRNRRNARSKWLRDWLYDEAKRRLQKAIVDKNIGQRSLLFQSWCR